MNILITGGLGFIGINTAVRFCRKGNKVVLFDNLSKQGSIKNYEFAKLLGAETVIGDIRNYNDILNVCKNYFDVVFHFAAQTAVTLSVSDPIADFQSNTMGTFYLLEAVRKTNPAAKIIYSSTNKVYGSLSDEKIIEHEKRYNFSDRLGIDETQPLDFYSPYGCSKGAADQYVRDYSRTYFMNTITVRQSCIYGEHQDGTEDQGWVAWFIKAFLKSIPITIYGDGKQVRDILYVGDLVNFYEKLIYSKNFESVYNIGGGFSNSLSLIELIDILHEKINNFPIISFSEERIGDQKIFISDNTKARNLGWEPVIGIKKGLDKLIHENRNLLSVPRNSG
jgi:CDP-paratose 2-epimerase